VVLGGKTGAVCATNFCVKTTRTSVADGGASVSSDQAILGFADMGAQVVVPARSADGSLGPFSRGF